MKIIIDCKTKQGDITGMHFFGCCENAQRPVIYISQDSSIIKTEMTTGQSVSHHLFYYYKSAANVCHQVPV